jgi:KaiC domain protein
VSEDDEDGDWFEKALRESESESNTADGDTASDETTGGGATDDSADGEGPFSSDGFDGDTGAFSGTTAESDSPFGGDTDGTDNPFGDDTDDSGSPFDDDGDGAAGSPFGDGDDDPFGGGDGESLFDEDFGSAFDSGSEDEFDDDELDSDIPRIDLGIEGLDNMIQGGVPQHHLMVTIGSAGTGKTTFGLQFLYHGLQKGENAVYITLEQSHESIIDTANEWGWGFDEYEAEDSLAVVDLDPVEMANSLDNIRGELPELIKEFNADRLVLDSVSLLEMMYDNPAKRRTEVFDFTRSLKAAGVTTFLTSEASESNPYASRHGIIEYLTDAVFVLQYIRGETRETRLAVEIQKIRNANHSREMKPYDITSEGLSVYQQANIF